jgi:short-subunit dehydrogenase
MTGVAWCTGAGKGIGRAVCLRLTETGYYVAASARTADDLDSLASEAARRSRIVRAFPLDVADAAAVGRCVDAIETSMGAIDLAVLNAGTHTPVSATSFDLAAFHRLMDINFFGVVNGLAVLLPRFIERKHGHVAVVASVAGYRGLPSAVAYGASKAALINMCEALKPELERHNVRLSLINPGFVRTPLTDRNDFPMPFLMEPDAAAERLVAGLASGRFEIAFPRRLTWPMKAMRCLPYALYFALTRRLLRS